MYCRLPTQRSPLLGLLILLNTLDVFREPPKLLALLELGPSLPNAPPRRVTSKMTCAIPLAKLATRPLHQRRVQRTVMWTSVLPGLRHANAPPNLTATAAGETAEMDTKTRAAHAFARLPRVLVTGMTGVWVSPRTAVASPSPTDCATKTARLIRTMLDPSVGAMSAPRDTSAVEWAFARLTKNRATSTSLWSARRSASWSVRLLSVFSLGARAVELAPSVWKWGSIWRSQPESLKLKTSVTRSLAWTAGGRNQCVAL